MKRACPVCGDDYEADPKRLRHNRQTTCSRSCSYAWRGARLQNSVTVVCPICNKEVRRMPSQIKGKHGAHFCSRECHYLGRKAGLSKRVITKPYHYTELGRERMRENGKNSQKPRVYHWTICRQCGTTFDDPSDSRERESGLTFCSLPCCNQFRRGEHNPAWRGGHPKYYGPDWRPLRRAARLRDGYACRRCGKKTQRAPDVHHIRPVIHFADPNEANTLDNVVCLCPPCHRFAEWHGIDFPLP